jgi:hypothetical protein
MRRSLVCISIVPVNRMTSSHTVQTAWRLQIIIPRGVKYKWRGTRHVPALLHSEKFKGGPSLHTLLVEGEAQRHVLSNDMCFAFCLTHA